MPQVKQTGLVLLQENEVGIQIIDSTGNVVFSYQEPEQVNKVYSGTELLQLVQTGKSADGKTTVFSGMAFDAKKEYAYLLYFYQTTLGEALSVYVINYSVIICIDFIGVSGYYYIFGTSENMPMFYLMCLMV